MALIPEFFPDIEGFQWDEGNASKSSGTHGVSWTEAEQVFMNRPVRYFAFGRTNGGRVLTVVFTIRGTLLRVISARPMSRRERRGYGQATRS